MSNETILRAAKVSGIPAADIIGRRKTPDACLARYAVMDALRAKGLSLPSIGRLVHRHHTTVLDGLRQANTLRGNPGFQIIRSAIA